MDGLIRIAFSSGTTMAPCKSFVRNRYVEQRYLPSIADLIACPGNALVKALDTLVSPPAVTLKRGNAAKMPKPDCRAHLRSASYTRLAQQR